MVIGDRPLQRRVGPVWNQVRGVLRRLKCRRSGEVALLILLLRQWHGRAGRRVRRCAGIQRVERIDRQAQRGRLHPRVATAPGQAVQLVGLGLERTRVLAGSINFKQFQAYRIALGMAAQRFLEDFFGLGIAAISDIDVRFRNRVDFICVERAHRRHKIGMEDAVVGVDARLADLGKVRGPWRARVARHVRLDLGQCRFLAARCDQRGGASQQGRSSDAERAGVLGQRVAPGCWRGLFFEQ